MINLIQKLERDRSLTKDEWISLFTNHDADTEAFARQRARLACEQVYGDKVFLRGLIEISSFCKNDCLYCGLRRSNQDCQRYRLTAEQILECCDEGYALGYRTFVMQGGEDMWFTDERIVEIVSAVHARYPDCAITLSLGERSKESYQRLYDAGARRYLLRHETADAAHYARLHPKELSLENRMNCLYTLRRIGYQTGAGMMIGSPGQTPETLAEDMLFLSRLQPHMVGIGPFLPHHATPFRGEKPGSAQETLFVLALTRLMLPDVLLPATTALATREENGREEGLLAGANVIMPNLSPKDTRAKYLLYDGKRATGSEAAESLRLIRESLARIGRKSVVSRGDHISILQTENKE